ncbi:hypothetical protein EPUS_00637 [Endocarpon pusillum Z07020]|uniref:Uncharacterized protein n=1 Tax=Endocarpon pusillum (strain Z07020 / HMAS-L-300199) TaxID=1263415 RepID=U1GHS6_ENDPU|nr:uncharacterized protein EPUS_00637 [Endocarpon pusillum Z07020]ERF71648.1 hypothetical protein EPUS_00637 [Endocarpon pusillum Z07020]
MSLQASGNGNNGQNKTSLKSTNLDKVPSSSPLREYLASDQSRGVRFAADDRAGGGNTTLHDLNNFMQQNTDKNIVDDARNSMASGTSNTHWGRK